MKAKLVRLIEPREDRPYYFRQYELECIDCGDHYFNGHYDKRTIPYCPACHRKHERVKQRERNMRKQQEMINEVLDKITEEIERKANSGQWSEAVVYGMAKAITIIDKYRGENDV